MSHQHVTQEMRQCAQECSACHDVCLETVQHCLHMGGRHADPHHVRLLLDCVQICETSKDFMLRGSELHGHTCAACAAVCERCADGCEKMGGGDQQMKLCADTCRRCAASCRRMAGAGGGH